MGNVTAIDTARRLVNWENTRWNWKRGIRCDKRLTDAAKVLAAALCDQFADRDTGACFPSVSTLAESLGKSERSIQRSIAALRDAGWLDTVVRGRGDRGGRGGSRQQQGSEFIFLLPGEKAETKRESEAPEVKQRATTVSPFRPKGDTQRVTPVTVKGDIRVVPPCTPYKDKPNLNQRARDTQPASTDARHPVPLGSFLAESWSDWLKAKGFPDIEVLADRVSHAGEEVWLMPIRSPPTDSDVTGMRIALRWAEQRKDRI